jgi:hypothetical protein
MTFRVIWTVGAWFLGLYIGGMRDGQNFSNSIVMMVFLALGALPWLSLVGRRGCLRMVAVGIIGVSVILIFLIALALPRARREQEEHNQLLHHRRPNSARPPATPHPSLQPTGSADH